MSDAFWGMAGTVLVTLIGLATLFIQLHYKFRDASEERLATAALLNRKIKEDAEEKDAKLGHIEHLVNSEADRMRREIDALKALLAGQIATSGKSKAEQDALTAELGVWSPGRVGE